VHLQDNVFRFSCLASIFGLQRDEGYLKGSIPCKASLQRLLQLKLKERIQPIGSLKLWPSSNKLWLAAAIGHFN
jgi:hypothetical protein